MKKLSLNENFVSRIWLNPSYYNDLKTTDGRIVKVINYGNPNSDSGADFSDAIIKINDTIYSGDIEIHQSVKDWNVHKHKKDAKYNKVILNVALWDDEYAEKSKSLSKRKRLALAAVRKLSLEKLQSLLVRRITSRSTGAATSTAAAANSLMPRFSR